MRCSSMSFPSLSTRCTVSIILSNGFASLAATTSRGSMSSPPDMSTVMMAFEVTP
uniref:Uncharacterized protein n=1 Tax=Arundo donax TaxID=35708 RepID=A0A0A8Z3H2_ARUDO